MNALKKYGPHLFFILPAMAFVAAGIGKLMGIPMLHDSFATMGLPAWFGYFIGTCEIGGAIGLMIPRLRKSAAAGLAVIMVGATYFHMAYAVPSPVPAVILLVLLIVVMAWDWKGTTTA